VFSAGLALRIRMYVALALNAAFLAVAVAVAVALVVAYDWRILIFPLLFVIIGAFGDQRTSRRRWNLDPVKVERAERAVARLSVLADIRPPQIRGQHDGPPLTWTTAIPGQHPRIHVTQALLDQLGDRELEAVLAHELSHIANRDAVLMTVLAAPGLYILRGMRTLWHDPDSLIRAKLAVIMFGSVLVVPALVSAGLARIVSRHRELAADRAAALLTGSPAAVTSALLQLSGELAVIPTRDLRGVVATDLLHIVPVRPQHGIRRLWATHPRLTTRVRELERWEERLQAG
jgi:heat shock protein HtpX